MIIILISLAAAAGMVYLWFHKKVKRFQKHCIKSQTGKDILFDTFCNLAKIRHFSTSVEIMYNQYRNDRFSRCYLFGGPGILIRDLEVIKQICIKDYDRFIDHRNFSTQEHCFFNKSLFSLKGQEWRDMRSTLSPVFTGSKLRNMVPLMQECGEDVTDYLLTQIKEQPDKYLDVDTHDVMTRYTNDVIATCAFGLKINSTKDRDNEFYMMGNKLTKTNLPQLFKLFLLTAVPIMNKFNNIHIFSKDAVKFLSKIVLDTIKDRDEKETYRPDIIQLLLEAKKGILSHEHVNDDKDAGFATVEESAIGKNELHTCGMTIIW